MYLDKIDAATKAITGAAYPEYKGRTVKVTIQTHPIDVRSYWDGSSRDYFRFVNLSTKEVLAVPPQSAFDRPIEGADKVTLPAGFVCVAHSIFCGKDAGITIMVHPDNAPLLITSPQDELTADEQIVLLYSRCRKSSYAGQDRCQMAQADISSAQQSNPAKPAPITRQSWEVAKANLIASGYLNKAGAITPKGRNATEGKYI